MLLIEKYENVWAFSWKVLFFTLIQTLAYWQISLVFEYSQKPTYR
jgi:hypothetical protein